MTSRRRAVIVGLEARRRRLLQTQHAAVMLRGPLARAGRRLSRRIVSERPRTEFELGRSKETKVWSREKVSPIHSKILSAFVSPARTVLDRSLTIGIDHTE